jgi:CRP/FNR family transcriptional regulator, anaerobic regulatory protein
VLGCPGLTWSDGAVVVNSPSNDGSGPNANRVPSPCDRCGARSRSFCAALKGQEFQQLSAISLSRSFEARQTIVQEGDAADFLINVVSGTMKIFRALPDGRTQVLGFLGEGDFMGMPPSNTYAVSAEAVTAVTVCSFPRHSFERLLRDSPLLERELFHRSSNEISAAHDHMLLLGRKTARERVATFLVIMASRCDSGAAAHCIVTPMTRAEIADYLGLTMETVSRTLTAFRREKLISFDGPDRLRIPTLDGLQRIASGDS